MRPTASQGALLDTSVLIQPSISPIPGMLSISVASLAELHFGVLATTDAAIRAERLRRLTLLERQFNPWPVDAAVAASYGQLAAAVVAAGRQPRRRTMDLLIAATAHAHRLTLHTRNVDDFVGLEDFIEVVGV